MVSYRVSHRVWFAGLCLGACLFVGWWLLSPRPTLEVAGARPPERAAEASRAAALEGASLESPRTRLEPIADGHSLEAAGSPRSSPQPESAATDEVWQLVARLEELAYDPASFHARALAVIAELEAVCVDRSDVDDSKSSVVEDLTVRVVEDVHRRELVRGAVLLAIDRLLPAERFGSTFSGWFAEGGTPSELLRAAAISAARRGAAAPCSVPLDLGFLAKLQSQQPTDAPTLPGLYPLKLGRLVSLAEAATLEGWLEDAREQARVLQRQGGAQGPGADRAGQLRATDSVGVADFFATAEVLFAIWGHGALQDAQIERVVLSEALQDEEARATNPSVFIRVASFLVHSFPTCNERLSEIAERMRTTDDPVLSALAKSMSGLAPADSVVGLDAELTAKIESLRYATSEKEQGHLVMALMDAGDSLPAIADAHSLAQANDYLNGLVQDPGVHELARAFALTALSDNGSWKAFLESAFLLLQSDCPDDLRSIALGTLSEHARENRARRADALTLLEKLRRNVTDSGFRESLDAHIAELSDS